MLIRVLLFYWALPILTISSFSVNTFIWEKLNKLAIISSWTHCTIKDELHYCQIVNTYQGLFKGPDYAKKRYEYIMHLKAKIFGLNSSIFEFDKGKDLYMLKQAKNSFKFNRTEYYFDLNYYVKDSNRDVLKQMCIYTFDHEDALNEKASHYRNCPWLKGICTYSDKEIGDHEEERINWNKIVYRNGTPINSISYGCTDKQLCCGLECCDMVNEGIAIVCVIWKLVKSLLDFIFETVYNYIPKETRDTIEAKIKSLTCGIWRRNKVKCLTCGQWTKKSSEVVDEPQQEEPDLIPGAPLTTGNENNQSGSESATGPDTAIGPKLPITDIPKINKKQEPSGQLNKQSASGSIEMQKIKQQATNPSRIQKNRDDAPTTSSSGSTRQTQPPQDEETQPLLEEEPSTSMSRQSSSIFNLVNDSTTKGREEEM